MDGSCVRFLVWGLEWQVGGWTQVKHQEFERLLQEKNRADTQSLAMMQTTTLSRLGAISGGTAASLWLPLKQYRNKSNRQKTTDDIITWESAKVLLVVDLWLDQRSNG